MQTCMIVWKYANATLVDLPKFVPERSRALVVLITDTEVKYKSTIQVVFCEPQNGRNRSFWTEPRGRVRLHSWKKQTHGTWLTHGLTHRLTRGSRSS